MQQVPALTYNRGMDVWLIPCNQVSSLPTLTFFIGGLAYDVPNYEWTAEVCNPSPCASLHPLLGSLSLAADVQVPPGTFTAIARKCV